MTPITNNEYYEPTLNELVFPAGILQPPFLDREVDDAVNFGGIGSVIGHELTHGFDDEGRQFDADGNLRDWWSKTVDAEFDRRAECVKKQYDEYTVLGDVHCGSCWAFSTLASLESTLLPGEKWDFSENNMRNTHGFDLSSCQGGNSVMAAAYLTRWSGVISGNERPLRSGFKDSHVHDRAQYRGCQTCPGDPLYFGEERVL